LIAEHTPAASSSAQVVDRVKILTTLAYFSEILPDSTLYKLKGFVALATVLYD
jgi:hypothetical protein